MKRVVWENEPPPLLGSKPVFDQRQIQILLSPIDFVADNGMAEVREMNADLMFAPGARHDAQ